MTGGKINIAPTFTRTVPGNDILFAYYIYTNPLAGRDSVCNKHLIPDSITSVGFCALVNAIWSELNTTIISGSEDCAFIIGTNPNDDVYIKYDIYTDSGSQYCDVTIINNKDVPIYYGYIFRRVFPAPLSTPEFGGGNPYE